MTTEHKYRVVCKLVYNRSFGRLALYYVTRGDMDYEPNQYNRIIYFRGIDKNDFTKGFIEDFMHDVSALRDYDNDIVRWCEIYFTTYGRVGVTFPDNTQIHTKSMHIRHPDYHIYKIKYKGDIWWNHKLNIKTTI